MTNTLHEKKKYIQLLQVISAFAVICLHCNSFGALSNSFRWMTANFEECLFYYAVPIFFMISGATLANFTTKYGITTYFKKRIIKVIIPYIAWSIIAILYRFVFQNITSDVIVISLPYIFERLLKSDALPIFWFFPFLFCVYLSFPIFAYLEKENRQKILGYLVWGGLIINISIPFISRVFHLPYSWPFKIDVISEYLLYSAAGIYFDNAELRKRTRIGIYFLGFFGFLVHFVGTHVLSLQTGTIVTIFKGYTNLPTVLYSFGIFVFFKQIGDQVMAGRLGKKIDVLSKYTFACYLIHWFILDLMVKFSGLNLMSYWYRLIMPFVTYAIIVAITWLIRKIPIIRRILPG